MRIDEKGEDGGEGRQLLAGGDYDGGWKNHLDASSHCAAHSCWSLN